MSGANPWLGLGARPAPRGDHPRTGSNASSSDDEVDAFARPSVQRIVPAAGLPLPVSLPVSRPAITTTPPPTQAPTEEAPAMASKPPTTTPTPTGLQHQNTQGGGEPRHAMLLHLEHSPTGLTRRELKLKLGWSTKQATNATYNASRAGLVEVANGGLYTITEAGKGWLAVKGSPVEGTAPATPAAKASPTAFVLGLAARRANAAQSKAPAGKKVVDVAQHDAAQATAARARVVQAAGEMAKPMGGAVSAQALAPWLGSPYSALVAGGMATAPTFRAAVYSDGGFCLSKDGQSIELTATGHAQLLRHLERMAEAE